MSCSARIPVYTIMTAAFVPAVAFAGIFSLQGLVFGAMYFVGILVAIPVALVLKWTVLRGESSTFVMELPPYRLPQAKTVLLRVFQSSRGFVQQAGTIIFAMSIVIWALGTFPRSSEVAERYEAERATARADLDRGDLEGRLAAIDARESGERLRASALGRMGRAIEPVVEPLGWDWTLGMAAISAFPARELLVSTLNIVHGLGDAGGAEESTALVDRLRASRRPDGSPTFTLAVALSVMVFIALCCQCASTLAVMRRETGSWRWPILAFVYMTTLAYAGALLTFQLGSAIGL
jgi:ferrous iron transport protein B